MINELNIQSFLAATSVYVDPNFTWTQAYTSDADVLVVRLMGSGANPTITYGGQALTLQAEANDGDQGETKMYHLISPPAGVNDLVIATNANRTWRVVISSLTGVDTTNPVTGTGVDSGYKATLSSTAVSVDGGLVLDAICIWDTFTAVAGAGQAETTTLEAAIANYTTYTSSEAATTTSTVMDWVLTGSANRVSQVAVAYTPASNTAPVIDTPEADIVEPAGTALTRDISDNSSDADLDTLTYSVSPALPAGITLSETTGVITATTATVAQVPTDYTFTHSDGTDSVDDVVSIHITGILSVGGDNEMDNNETDVLITTTGLPASVTTLTSIKVDGVTMDNPRWNGGQPLFDAPAGMALGSALDVEVEFTE